MPKYTAEKYSNSRDVRYHDFEAGSDAEALEYIVEYTEQGQLDWIDREDSDADCGSSDTLIDLHLTGGNEAVVAKGIKLKSDMPYSWDAREFVKKVAALLLFKEAVAEDGNPAIEPNAEVLEGDHQALEALIVEARKLCGMA